MWLYTTIKAAAPDVVAMKSLRDMRRRAIANSPELVITAELICAGILALVVMRWLV